MYYLRTIHVSSLFDSDVVVFYIPPLVAFCGYFMVTWLCNCLPQDSVGRVATAVLIALIGTIVSSTVVMAVAFNRFGT